MQPSCTMRWPTGEQPLRDHGCVPRPPRRERVFDEDVFERLVRGETCIEEVSDAYKQALLDRTSCGSSRAVTVQWTCLRGKLRRHSQLAGVAHAFDLAEEFGVDPKAVLAGTSPPTGRGVGLLALRDAAIPLTPEEQVGKVAFGSSVVGKFHNTSVSGPVWCLPHVSQAPQLRSTCTKQRCRCRRSLRPSFPLPSAQHGPCPVRPAYRYPRAQFHHQRRLCFRNGGVQHRRGLVGQRPRGPRGHHLFRQRDQSRTLVVDWSWICRLWRCILKQRHRRSSAAVRPATQWPDPRHGSRRLRGGTKRRSGGAWRSALC